jgi:glycosyltransferase involved in cell wall biosynthesis
MTPLQPDTPSQPDARLVTRIDTPLPARLAADRRNLLFVSGSCYRPGSSVVALELAAGGAAEPAIAHSMPRPDLAGGGSAAFRSGFWAILPIPASLRPRTIAIELTATLDDGSRVSTRIGSLDLAPMATSPSPNGDHRPGTAAGAPVPQIAICMATHEPPPELLERQIDSIRAQTHGSWVCVISDDCSSPDGFAALERVVGDDPRFVVTRSPRRLGFFHNFERALQLAPPRTEFIALADQDDRWHPDKLSALVGGIGAGMVAYSDARIVDARGNLLSETYWSQRRNNNSNLTSLLLANTVSGSGALFRRRVVERSLPFPHGFGKVFHDQWLALVGLALGEIVYVDRPLYDYVQHDDALLGHERAQAWAGKTRSLATRLRDYRSNPRYFYEHWRTTYFQEYCRAAGLGRLLLMRCGAELSESRKWSLRRFVDAERSPGTAAWLLLRQLRRLAGRNETLGAEGRLVRAFAWRQLLEAQPAEAAAVRSWLPRHGGYRGEAVAPPTPEIPSRIRAGIR